MKHLFAFLFLLAGTSFIIYGCITINHSRSSKSWPTIEGIIVDSNLRQSLVKKPATKTNSNEKKFSPTLAFEYQIDGKKYKGTLISFSETATRKKSKAKAVIAKYPVGSRQPIYYKPSNPEVAVLEPGMKKSLIFIPIIGLILFFCGISALKEAIRKRKRV